MSDGAAADDSAHGQQAPGKAVTRNEVSGTVHGPVIQASQIDAVNVTITPPERIVPAQLPTSPVVFVGRDAELGLLDSLLTGPGTDGTLLHGNRTGGPLTRMVLLTGVGGLGKSALAVHWASGAAGRFPDGQLYVDLQGFSPAAAPLPPAEALRGFLTALGVEGPQIPADLGERAALFRSLCAGRRVLIVLDNAAGSEQVQPLIPGGGASAVLITSRRYLAGLVMAGAESISLGYLPEEEGLDLLLARVGRRRVETGPGPARQLVAYCGGLPLALSIIAARAAFRPSLSLEAICEDMSASGRRLDVLGLGEATANLRIVFSWSYDALSPAAARLFRLLSLVGTPDLGLPAIADLAGVTPREAERLTDELSAAHLLEETHERRFRQHDLVKLYANELLEREDDAATVQAALTGLLDYYLAAAVAASALLIGATPLVNSDVATPEVASAPAWGTDQVRTRAQAKRWFDVEDASLLTILAISRRPGFEYHSSRLPLAVDNVWVWRGRLPDVLAMWQAAVAGAESRQDVVALSYACRFLGLAEMRFGLNDAAVTHLEASVRACQEVGDGARRASAELNLATVFARQGRLPLALQYAGESLAGFRVQNIPSGAAHALNLLGGLHARSGDTAQGLADCAQAIEIAQSLGDPNGEADILDQLGLIHARAHSYPEAVVAHERAIELYQQTEDDFGRADALHHLGDAQAHLDLAAARQNWSLALELFERAGRSHKVDEVRRSLEADPGA
jgi:tetratricopeptide (TPR) repeat protein